MARDRLAKRIDQYNSALLKLATSSALESGDISKAAQAITEIAALTLEVEQIGVWLFNHDQSEICCLDLFKRTSGTHQSGFKLHINDAPEYFSAICHDRVLVMHDTLSDPITKDFAYVRLNSITSMCDAPFHANRELAGIICSEHTGPKREWSIEEQNFIASLADMMSRALQISEKCRIASELERRSYAIECSIDGLAILDANEKFVYVNRAHAKVYGYSDPMELIGQSWQELYGPEELELFITEYMPVFRKSGVLRIDSWGKRKNGEKFPQEISLTALPDGGLICTVRDLTDRKLIQDQLLQSQKMEAVGQLAGGIAHDFNNLITGILGHTTLLKMECQGRPEIVSLADSIEVAADQASELTQKLLGFARKGKNQNVPIDLHAAIKEILPLVSRTIERDITIEQELDAPRPFITGDPVQIEQVILNLVLNARDAIHMHPDSESHGKLRIGTRQVTDLPTQCQAHSAIAQHDCVEVFVQDNGCGMSADVQSRIFEPFYTTKAPGKGSGLGLSMVYGIVKNHGGLITVESNPGWGATFHLYFPVCELAARSSITTSSKNSPTYELEHGHAHILLVDDHKIMREATAEILLRLGYDVVTAKDGVEALRYYRENKENVDLVIVDMIMPNLGAKECFREIRRLNPKVRSILSSGYGHNNLVQEIMNEGVCAFIQKPFEIYELSKVVADVLKEVRKLGDPSVANKLAANTL